MKHTLLSCLENWLFPPTCSITGVSAIKYDLSEEILSTLSPVKNSCYQCATALKNLSRNTNESNILCGQCLKESPKFNHTIAGFLYEGHMEELIKKYKFYQQIQLCRLLSDLYLQLNLQQLQKLNIEAIVAVPIHDNRLLDRGFNQSLELAKLISKRLHIPLIPFALQKIKDTPPQALLNAKSRKKNLNKAFWINTKQLEAFKHIAIVDDVMTTGTTLHKLSKEIKQKTTIQTITALIIARA